MRVPGNMVEIAPFKATILNSRVGGVDKLICPVYDSIDAKVYDKYASNKNNVVHFTTRRKGTPENEYIEYAKQQIDRSFREKVLIETEGESLYVYGIRYRLPDELLEQLPPAERRDQYFAFGLIALIDLESSADDIVGHENVFAANVTERYDVMKKCMMNFSPVSAEYMMPDHEINNLLQEYLGFKRPELKIDPENPPLINVILNGSQHILWAVNDSELIKKIQDLMSSRKVMILDGHHRYTASKQLLEKDGIRYTMMMFMDGGDRALKLLPWHRCIRNCDMDELKRRVKDIADVEVCDSCIDPEALHRRMCEISDSGGFSMAMYTKEGMQLMKLRSGLIEKMEAEVGEKIGIDLIILQNHVIMPAIIGPPEDLVFTQFTSEAVRKVNEDGFRAAFIVNPLRVSEVERKAHEEKRNFPQKSTFFLPKVAEGIAMWRIRE